VALDPIAGCTVRDGRIEQTNFDTWEVMRLDAMPKVETVVMPDGEFWGGVGEPTISVAAGGLATIPFGDVR
jgi:isoquinoline 1-oxidoreductase beta subunit